MFKLNKIAGSVIAVTAILGSAGVALADGYVPKGKVAYERPTNWSGFYFGVQSGYQWSDVDTHFIAPPNDFSVNHDSGFVGAHMGVQHQFGLVVLGVEGNWLSTLRDDPGETTCPNPAATCTQRLNDILSVGGRLGWAAGHWMPYVTGGYASGRFAYKAYTTATGVTIDDAGTRHSGWYLGGGFEWQVSPGWTAGLEYRHYEFGDAGTTPSTPAGVPILGDTYSADASVDTITARVSWRWGRPEPRPLK
ncbi:MAG: outer membrane protein [Hyphomicrobiaceae bacterium]